MRLFGRHHLDTPHGESHPTISVAVLLTVLFVGAQWIIYVATLVTTPVGAPTVYDGGNPFAVASVVVSLLLAAFLLVDFRRNRIEAHGGHRYQYIVFGIALVLLATFLVFLVKVIQQGAI